MDHIKSSGKCVYFAPRAQKNHGRSLKPELDIAGPLMQWNIILCSSRIVSIKPQFYLGRGLAGALALAREAPANRGPRSGRDCLCRALLALPCRGPPAVGPWSERRPALLAPSWERGLGGLLPSWERGLGGRLSPSLRPGTVRGWGLLMLPACQGGWRYRQGK